MTIRQLKMLDDIRQRRGVTIEQATEFNQVIFGSLCYRQWLEWDVGREMFRLSSEGKEARLTATLWDLHRMVNNHRLAKRATAVTSKVRLHRVA